MKLVEDIREFFNISPYLPIIPWIDKNIIFTNDVSAERDRVDWDMFPYQKEIIQHWEDLNTRKRVVTVAVEQVGKSTLWVLGLL